MLDLLLEIFIEDGYLLIAALYVIGESIKDTKKIDNNYIPSLLTVLGAFLMPLILKQFDVYAVLQGIVAAGLTVYGYELIGKRFTHSKGA